MRSQISRLYPSSRSPRRVTLLTALLLSALLILGVAVVASAQEEPTATPVVPANNPLVPVDLGPAPATEPQADPEAKEGAPGTCSSKEDGPSLTSGTDLSLFRTMVLRGSYTWDMVGMRNRGFGTLSIYTPPGTTVVAAYLWWTILGPTVQPAYSHGVFAGHYLTGGLVGHDVDPCWNMGQSFSYRADVTAWAGGTGSRSYALSRFASSRTDGSDPWTLPYAPAPLAEGATLVVVYSKPTYPLMTIKLYNGNKTVNSTSSVASLTVSGFTASNPVGPVYGLFIGADGQSASEPPTGFRGIALNSIKWDGAAHQSGANYGQGNLWDTEGQQLGRILRPGDTSAVVRVRGSPDCLTWVAFVFSIASGTADTDGDALLDGWELNGYDDNGDGVFDFYLPGANVLHKDLYVEVDWMADASHSHKPVAAVKTRAGAMFNNAPVSNPNGINGISIHIDDGTYGGGNSITHQSILGSWDASGNYNWTAFQNLKNVNFNNARRRIWHYCMFVHNIRSDGTSGISHGIPASDYIVALGAWTGGVGSTDEQTGTFVHELGHNLGLKHGGNDHVNYKPNYISIMSYSFQMSGLYQGGTWGHWDYQRLNLPNLDENNLNEWVGLGAAAAGYGTSHYSPGTWARRNVVNANVSIDWNCNGGFSNPVAADINKTNTRTVLGTQNNWPNIVYDGGLVGAPVSAMKEVLPMQTPDGCLSKDEYDHMEGK